MTIFPHAALPLGLHLGQHAFALCELVRSRAGAALQRVIFEPYDGREPALAVAAVVREQGWLRRRCVAGIGGGVATLHALQLPPMPARERLAAARIEAERLASEPDVPLAVDVAAVEHGWMLAAAPRTAVRSVAQTVAGSGLRLRAIDLEMLALGRALDARAGDAVLEIGTERSILMLATGGVPFTRVVRGGGTTAPETLAAGVAEALDFARSRGFGAARRILLSGAGAAVDGAGELLGGMVRIPTHVGAPRAEVSTERYPPDFIRATAPHWLPACGLALWETGDRL